MQITRVANGYLYFITLLLGIFLAQLVWKIVALTSPSAAYTPSNMTDSPVTKTAINNSNDLQSIISAHIFGAPKSIKTVPINIIPSTTALKKTQLNLRLSGLIKGNKSVAVIIYQGQQRPYAPGDFIVNTKRLKVQLAAVYHSYVIIINNGVEERLSLPKKVKKSGAQSGILAVPTTTLSTIAAAPSLSVNLNSAPLKALIGANPRHIITTNPLSLSKFLQISPSITNGKLHGYKISNGPDQRLLKATGIIPGDMVTHVDGTAVAGLTIPSMYQMLQKNSRFRMTINRDGAVITMEIKL